MGRKSFTLSSLGCLLLTGCTVGIIRGDALPPGANLSLGDKWRRAADGMVMVYVPGGTFEMGSDEDDPEADANETPRHAVTLDGFWIDRTEVTVAQFRRFVTETGHETTAEREGYGLVPTEERGVKVDGADWQHPQGPGSTAQDDHPVVQVSLNDAGAYCEWAGAQVPTEAQWEYAARGPDSYVYPWGSAFDGALLSYCDVNCPFDHGDTDHDDGYEVTAPVGSYPGGASWCGAHDMAGNVWERVVDFYDSEYYSHSPSHNPAGPQAGNDQGQGAVRGGAWNDNFWAMRASVRFAFPRGIGAAYLGFRCVAVPVATETPTPEPVPITFPKIDRWPAWETDAPRHGGAMSQLPVYDPRIEEGWQVDLRGHDLSSLDLRGSRENLLYASFDHETIWPPDERMPGDYDWREIMEAGKNPGLGVRSLHALGVTGRGVGIAIIGHPLLVGHQEYRDRVQLYEEINIDPDTGPVMGGAAHASIAVGQTTGVAPEADLYYIASWAGDWGVGPEGFTYNFVYHAQAVRRVLAVNDQLPEEHKIRAISISLGWNPEQAGYDEMAAAVEDAKAAGMLIVSSCIDDVHGFEFHGLGREPLSDPDAFESYGPGLWWTDTFYAAGGMSDRLLVPMQSRTTASPWGDDGYVFYREGGWGFVTPYIAGLYALATQVDPTITPYRFWSLAMETGYTVEVDHNGESLPLGPIADPVALIEALQD